MTGFVKLDTGILNSSLWVERDLRSIFVTALVMAEPFELKAPTPQLGVRSLDPTEWMVPAGWYGFVEAAGTGIVRRDGMTDIEAGLALLESLCSPDQDSRSQAFEGRRLARVDGGYLVLNYFDYRDRDYGAADRMRRLRARRKAENTITVTPNIPTVTPNVTQAESRGQRTENILKPKTDYPADFELIWNAYPKREGGNPKGSALKAYNARLREGVDFTLIQDGTFRYAVYVKAKAWIGTEFVMQASRFLGPDKLFLESWETAAPRPNGVLPLSKEQRDDIQFRKRGWIA